MMRIGNESSDNSQDSKRIDFQVSSMRLNLLGYKALQFFLHQLPSRQ